MNADYSTKKDAYLDAKVEIYLDVYKKEQPRLGEVGSYSIFNNLGGAKRIIFHLAIPTSTYDFLDKACVKRELKNYPCSKCGKKILESEDTSLWD